MEKVKNIPTLRFPEFNGEWEMKKLGEVAKFSKGKGISKSEISEVGINECIRYGELYTRYGEVIKDVFSKTNFDINKSVVSEANDVIIPASGETQIDIATASCVMKSGIILGGDLNIIKTNKNGVFLSYYLNNKRKLDIANLAQGISVVHLYPSQLALLKLNFPPLSEQQKIATFLTAVDDKLSALKQKKSLLVQYKKGVMQKIFSQELRFTDENGNVFADWEEKKLGELTFKVDKKNKENIKYPVYSINNKEGFLPQSDQFEGMDSNERGYDISLYKIIESNTFAYNPARINVGSIGFSGELSKIIISSLYVCFKTIDLLEDTYLLHFLNTKDFNKSVFEFQEGGVRSYLFYESFSKIPISLPSNKEQTKIANFLSVIDKKINQCQAQISKTEVYKKGLLQGMFV